MSAADKTLLIRRLEARDSLSAEEQNVIQELPSRIREFQPDEELVAYASLTTESCLMLDGFSGRAHYLSDGGRQISAVHLPGDFVDLHSLLLKKMDHGVIALTPCRAAFIPHDAIRRVIDDHHHLSRMLWLWTLVDGSIQRALITSLGRRSAAAQLAHLICELYVRLGSIGLTAGNSFDFPVTQSMLADILGMSTVHVNRTLQELRQTGCVSWLNKTITVHRFDGLAAIADFDPIYLHLQKFPR